MWDSVQTMQGQIHLYIIVCCYCLYDVSCDKVRVVVGYQLHHLHALGGGEQQLPCPLLPMLCSMGVLGFSLRSGTKI